MTRRTVGMPVKGPKTR